MRTPRGGDGGIDASAFALKDTALETGAGIRHDVRTCAVRCLGPAHTIIAVAVGTSTVGATTKLSTAAGRGTLTIVGIHEDRMAIASVVACRLSRERVAGS